MHLLPGVPMERTQQAGGYDVFALEVQAGNPLLIQVEQLGIDVLVAVLDPRGESLVMVDSPLGREGPESLLLEPRLSGRYTVYVRSKIETTLGGRFSIRVDELPSATPEGRLRLRAEADSTAAGRLFAAGDANLGQPPAAKLEEALMAALVAWRTLGDPRRQAETWMLLAKTSENAGDSIRAVSQLERALERWRQLDAPARLAATLDTLGRLLDRRGDSTRALAHLQEALALRQAIGDRGMEAATHNQLCLMLQRTGRWPEAGECYEAVLATARELADGPLEARVLNNLGGVEQNLGEPEPALAYYQQALERRRRLGDEIGQAQTLNNLGALARGLGEMDDALRFFGRASELFEQAGKGYWQARTLNNLGATYLSLGELERARSYLLSALPMRREVGDQSGEAVTLRNLGWVSAELGEPGKALAFYDKALQRSLELDDRRGVASARKLLGELHLDQGNARAAGEELLTALESLRAMGKRQEEAEVLELLSRSRLALDDLREAGEHAARALELYRGAHDPLGEMAALVALARVDRKTGRPEQALERLETATRVLESVHRGIGVPGRKASFLASQREVVELLVDTLMTLHDRHPSRGHDRAALEASERARSRALLGMLGGSGAGLGPGVDPALRTRLQAAERQVTAKTSRQLRLLGSPDDPEPLRHAEQELYRALSELEEVRSEIRQKNPRYATLQQPTTLDEPAIRALLDESTVLLEFFLGQRRSFLWWLTKDSVATFELPPRPEIEALAGRVHAATSAPNRSVGAARKALAALAEVVLGPVASQLKDQRLVIVADGALHLVPFAALPSPRQGELLLAHHELVYLPSASVLAGQRRELASAEPPLTPRAHSLAIFADPAFDPTSGRYDRLPHTRHEAEAIAALVPEDHRLLALGSDAQRQRVIGQGLGAFHLLHFATHGLIHPRTPELSGLALAELGHHGESLDGFLGLSDVSNLDLSAELVVLSGCHTALGKQIRGEGFVGLAHGFMVAGAQRVVASLWQVRDQATAELMTSFYRAMLESGQRPAAALRAAQLELRQRRRYRDPFYWAAFTLQGDWR